MLKTRVCYRCKVPKELSKENFCKDSARPEGFAYECRPCLSMRKKGKDKRNPTLRWAEMTPEQKRKRREACLRYEHTPKGHAVVRVSSYRSIDASKGKICTITNEQMRAIMDAPCFYCGHQDGMGGPIGLTRQKPIL